MYSILSLLEQQEQTLQRLAITAALRRASRDTREDETVSDTELSEPPRQRRRTIYRRSALQSPVRTNVRFRNPPVENEPRKTTHASGMLQNQIILILLQALIVVLVMRKEYLYQDQLDKHLDLLQQEQILFLICLPKLY